MAKYANPRQPDYVCEQCGISFCEDEAITLGLEQLGRFSGPKPGCPKCREHWSLLRLTPVGRHYSFE